MKLIPIEIYAKQKGIATSALYQKARKGKLETAQEIDGVWMIGEDEVIEDLRFGKKKSKDLTGMRFGLLIAKHIDHVKNGMAYWYCVCDCSQDEKVSSDVVVRGSMLVSGNTKSCGCAVGGTEHLKKTYDGKKKYYVDGTVTYQIADTSKLSKNNTSGVRGVSFNKRKQKWRAYIRFKGKSMHLGYFDELEDAKAARVAAEVRVFGGYLGEMDKEE
ncbi:MAG: AP2 domain-containing protein [Defluviitaleaceae bacterium]|nr:AP2 domain-containing protein [Defluviitaleaceae bacterium]